ncbi:MAG: hypothetical protein MMC23_002499 [Stictis urceolatum]|nr:hypothetical protein [Stictis urceolata]
MPEWMAMYDITDVQELVKPPYTTLREPGTKTQRETDTMARISVGRYFFDLVRGWGGRGEDKGLRVQEKVEDGQSEEGNVLVSVNLLTREGKSDDVKAWYEREHIPLLSKVPGWKRSRLFLASDVETGDARGSHRGRGREGETEFLALHEYAALNGLGGKEFLEAVGTEWSGRVMGRGATKPEDAHAREVVRREYELYYTFGPAPRDVATLAGAQGEGAVRRWEYSSGKTRTFAKGALAKGSRAAVESYVTARDGVEIEYRLEGKGGDEAPLMVLSNSVLVTWAIWDGFVDEVLGDERLEGWRVLRYQTRGRYKEIGKEGVTLDVLTNDVIDLLDTLTVNRAAAVVGVSLGGATALSVGLKYPERVAAFVSCDTNAKSPAGNEKVWGERIAMAEKEGADGDRVGKELAEATVRRWFPNESWANGEVRERIETVRKMVEENSLTGFKEGVKALFEYDLEEMMKGYQGKGAFVVGEKDGKLPAGMKAMAESLGNGAPLKMIPGAGHLPMVERPYDVADFVKKFLKN